MTLFFFFFAGGSTFQAAGKSYCIEKLWHDPVPKEISYTGYVTEDGHKFACNHSKDVSSHVIFVVDRSGSMGSPDIKPKMVKFPENRLGCVFEAMVRFIRTRIAANLQDVMSVVLFDDHGQIAMEREHMSEPQVDKLLTFEDAGGTVYSSGIARVEEILVRSVSDPAVAGKSPAVVFLSDGDNYGGLDPVHCVNQLKKLEQSLIFHTIMFATDPTNSAKKLLTDMADAGDGMFQVSIDEIQLSRSFEDLAKSLRPKVASLM
ncbi:uncharacterized protein LOC112350273 [Selaginella moellendorffii]|uniref:uncharacterized protein LOC112350273 n=1 Tax=Selaginella moellendorffii TaxID=88036 RepID=UPI000D1C97A2|nr:uncharacterized protein LOC112350273 [Selaginella moellendorffii]|eukprot:XP_024541946.1 uncharacterized protein LOC112350273 [Selaginella moellendorffii]